LQLWHRCQKSEMVKSTGPLAKFGLAITSKLGSFQLGLRGFFLVDLLVDVDEEIRVLGGHVVLAPS